MGIGGHGPPVFLQGPATNLSLLQTPGLRLGLPAQVPVSGTQTAQALCTWVPCLPWLPSTWGSSKDRVASAMENPCQARPEPPPSPPTSTPPSGLIFLPHPTLILASPHGTSAGTGLRAPGCKVLHARLPPHVPLSTGDLTSRSSVSWQSVWGPEESPNAVNTGSHRLSRWSQTCCDQRLSPCPGRSSSWAAEQGERRQAGPVSTGT